MKSRYKIFCFLLLFLFILSGCKAKNEDDKTWFNKDIFSINFNKDARFIIFDKDFKYGFMDKNGKIVIKPIYYSVSDFTDGIAKVQVDKGGYTYYGLIDTQGNTILEPEYDEVEYFSEDIAAVQSDGKTGYINKKGKFIIWPKFDKGNNFSNGLAKVTLDGKVGFINKKGDYQIYPKYSDTGTKGFKDNKAIVLLNGKHCFINKNGEVVRTLEIDDVSDFSENLYIIKKNNKVGLMDNEGKIVLEPNYVSLHNIDDNTNFIVFESETSLFGVMNNKYNIIIPARYKSIADIGEGIISISDFDNNCSFLFDMKGKLLKKVDLFIQSGFSSELSSVTDKDMKYGFINKSGKLIIPCKYVFTETFKNGLAFVTEDIPGYRRSGYINTLGAYVWKIDIKQENENTSTIDSITENYSGTSNVNIGRTQNYSSNKYYSENEDSYYIDTKSEDIEEAESNILN